MVIAGHGYLSFQLMRVEGINVQSTVAECAEDVQAKFRVIEKVTLYISISTKYQFYTTATTSWDMRTLTRRSPESCY